MSIALLSLALNKPIRANIAMTGEVTLTGRVLKVGGIKEKMIGARRSGVTSVILPVDNRADFEELEEFIRQDFDVHYAATLDDAVRLVFDNAR